MGTMGDNEGQWSRNLLSAALPGGGGRPGGVSSVLIGVTEVVVGDGLSAFAAM